MFLNERRTQRAHRIERDLTGTWTRDISLEYEQLARWADLENELGTGALDRIVRHAHTMRRVRPPQWIGCKRIDLRVIFAVPIAGVRHLVAKPVTQRDRPAQGRDDLFRAEVVRIMKLSNKESTAWKLLQHEIVLRVDDPADERKAWPACRMWQ